MIHRLISCPRSCPPDGLCQKSATWTAKGVYKLAASLQIEETSRESDREVVWLVVERMWLESFNHLLLSSSGHLALCSAFINARLFDMCTNMLPLAATPVSPAAGTLHFRLHPFPCLFNPDPNRQGSLLLQTTYVLYDLPSMSGSKMTPRWLYSWRTTGQAGDLSCWAI
ncbi:hypothetical protein K437DRAFT_151980 [Tilletiaria anomala UBC 951]|uniref:Uncharacterized protein n=1 Tax=Tilletiaria anomala (strain ATCC 24038 / CBS 436.72 / UBC 951) TaxID=1037660 RepID=A0A066VTG4_TILAU|nr:uncharacterized protein K437DRAFT_151980 [Tilletiaria anomala UBC 951]KDN43568.1 hypothetical protein K437DRAFT_151980 [Tilletiaria anomala UBC 951]